MRIVHVLNVDGFLDRKTADLLTLKRLHFVHTGGGQFLKDRWILKLELDVMHDVIY